MTESNGPPPPAPRAFPPGFAWGCATSPTQIEGLTVNDWAGFLARDGTSPDDGPCHWERFAQDFALLGELGCNAYRFGFDWARLQPGPRAPLDRAAAHRYLEMLADLRARQIEPHLTLFHFALPQWLAARGGWADPETPALFADFARRVAELTGDAVRHWITINEPAVLALLGYVLGEFPPRLRLRFRLARRVLRHLALGHALAYEAIKERQPGAQVGFSKHWKRFLPARAWHPGDRVAAFLAARLFNDRPLDLFLRHRGRPVADFLGVNYYGRLRLRGWTGVAPLTGVSPDELALYASEWDEMWEQDPPGLAAALRSLSRRTGLPLYVTECGAATRDEAQRARLLLQHLAACREAAVDGAEVRGFFYWSLIDNYEWAEGLAKRFGLYEVDFADARKRRFLRPAGRLFARVARANALCGEDGECFTSPAGSSPTPPPSDGREGP